MHSFRVVAYTTLKVRLQSNMASGMACESKPYRHSANRMGISCAEFTDVLILVYPLSTYSILDLLPIAILRLLYPTHPVDLFIFSLFLPDVI